MTIKELIEKLNEYCDKEEIYDTEEILNNEMLEILESVDLQYVATVDHDEHRWFVIDENVYSVELEDGIHYLGTKEVGTIKSEAMTVEDCGCTLEFYEMEQVPSVTYRRKRIND